CLNAQKWAAHSPQAFQRAMKEHAASTPNEARCCKRDWIGQHNTACREKLQKEAYKHTKRNFGSGSDDFWAGTGGRSSSMSGCGRSAWVPLNAALVVMPWATSPRRRAVDTVGRNELAHRAKVLWAQLAPGKDGTRPYFLRATALPGAPIAAGLRSGRRRRRIACPGEEWTCALLLPEVDPTADEPNGARPC
ncbi:hypothetical protein TcG_09978, partial [Trypanosoma cruzi]